MLDEFSTVKLDPSKAAKSTDPAAPEPTSPAPALAPAPAPAAAHGQAEADDGFSEEEFAKQLQAGMADLLGELEGSVSPPPAARYPARRLLTAPPT